MLEKRLNLRYCEEVRRSFAGSSNGRTIASGAMYLGSNPGPAAV